MTNYSLPFIYGCFLSLALAQESSLKPLPITLDQKAARYFELLQKKPENAPVLQRFIDAWLENDDQKKLLKILRDKAKAGTANEWRILASASEFLGDDDSALSALNEAIKLQPEDAATRIARATLCAKMQSFDVALTDLELAMKNEALLLPAATLRGKLLAQTGRVEDAVKTWNELIVKFPADIGLQEDLLDLLIQENLLDQALISSSQLIEKTKDPYQKAMRRLRTAEILSLSGKKSEASAEYLAILEISAQDSWLERETIALAAKLHSAENDPNAWKKFLENAIAASPTRNALYQQQATVHQLASDFDAAEKIHQSLVAKNPGSKPIREAYTIFLLQIGKKEQALENTRHLLQAAPNDAGIWEQLATLHRDLKQTEPMNAAIAKIAATFPDDESGALQRALLYKRFDKLDTAEQVLRKATELYGAASDSADALAQFLFAQKKETEALDLWHNAAKTTDREGLLRITRSLSAIGKHQQAADTILARLADFPNDALVLSALCQIAPLLENPQSLMVHAMNLVRLAATTSDLESSINSAMAIISRSDATEKSITELTALAKPTIGELCLLAQLHESLGDSVSAERALDAAAQIDSSLAIALRRISLKNLRGDIAGAVESWRKLIALPGGNKPQHWKELTVAIRRSGNIQEAITTAKEWKAVAPGDKATYQTLAELHKEMGDIEQAIAEMRRMLAKFGADADNRGKLIDLLLEAGSNAEALRLALQLFDEAESSTEKLKQCPRIAMAAKADAREEEIENIFQKRARENASSTTALIALQEIRQLWQLQSGYGYDEKRFDFSLLIEAMRRTPEDKNLMLDVAERYNSVGMIDEAEALYRKLEQMKPDAQELRRIAFFYQGLGDEDKAQALIEKMIVESNNAQEIETHASQMFHKGEIASACDLLEKITKAHPDDWRLSYLYATCLYTLGRTPEAESIFLRLSQVKTELVRMQTTPPKSLTPHGFHENLPKMPTVEERFDRSFSIVNGSIYSAKSLLKSSAHAGHSSHFSHSALPLPVTSMDLRHFSIHYLLHIAANSEAQKKQTLLAKIYDPALPSQAFLSAWKTAVSFTDPSAFFTHVLKNKNDKYLLQIALVGGSQRYLIRDHRMHYNEQYNSSANKEMSAKRTEILDALAAIDPDLALKYTTVFRQRLDDEQLLPRLRSYLDLWDRCKPETRKQNAYAIISLASAPSLPRAVEELKPRITVAVDEMIRENPDFINQNIAFLTLLIRNSITEKKYAQAVNYINLSLDAYRDMKAQSHFSQSPNGINPRRTSASGFNGTESLPSYYTLQRQARVMSGSNMSMPKEQELFEQFGYPEWLQGFRNYGMPFPRKKNSQEKKIPTVAAAELQAWAKELGIQPQENPPVESASFAVNAEDLPGFVSAVSAIKFPIFRCIIFRELEMKEQFDKEFAAITADDSQVGAESLLWAAAYLSANRGDPARVYRLCLRATTTQLPRVHKDLADTMLLSSYMLLSDEVRATFESAPAQSAALRITKKTQALYNDDTGKPFATILTKIGLDNAAKRLVDSKSRLGSSSAAGRNSYHGSSQLSLDEKVSKALAMQNKKEAARLIFIDHRRSISAGQSDSGRAAQMIAKHGLKEEYIAIAAPPTGSSFQRRKDAALQMAKLLGHHAILETLAQLHQEQPTDSEIVGMYAACLEEKPALELLKRFSSEAAQKPEELMNQLLQTSMAWQRSHFQTKEDYRHFLGYQRVIAYQLALLDPTKPLDSQTYGSLRSIFQYYSSSYIVELGVSLPSFGQAVPPISPSASATEKQKHEAMSQLLQERELAIEAMVRVCLRQIHLREMAIETIVKGSADWQKRFENFDQYAADYLGYIASPSFAISEQTQNISGEQSARFATFFDTSGESLADAQSLQWLERLAENGQDMSSLAARIEAGLTDKAKQSYQTMLAMLRKPTNEAISAFLKNKEIQHATALKIAALVSKLRREDISPALQSMLKHPDFLFADTPYQRKARIGDSYWPYSAILTLITRNICSQDDVVMIEKHVNELANLFLGPAKYWRLYSETAKYPRDTITAQISQRYSTFNNQISLVTQNEGVPLGSKIAVNRFLMTTGLSSPSNLGNRATWRNGNNDEDTQATIVAYIAEHLDAGLFRMTPSMLATNQDRHPFFSSLFMPQLSRGTKDATIFAEELRKIKGNDAFWAQITALMYEKPTDDAFALVLKRELKAIKTWSSEQQALLASWLKTNHPEFRDASLVAWIAAGTKAAVAHLALELESKAASNEGNNFYELIAILTRMFELDPQATASVWVKLLTQEAQSPTPIMSQQTLNNSTLTYLQYAHYDFLGKIINRSFDPYQCLELMSQVDTVPWDENIKKIMSTNRKPQLFRSSHYPNPKAIHPKITNPYCLNMIRFHQKVDDAKLISQPLYLEAYFSNSDYNPGNDYTLMEEWVEQTYGKQQTLAAKLARFSLAIFSLSTNHSSELRVKAEENIEELLVEFIGHKEIPLSAKDPLLFCHMGRLSYKRDYTSIAEDLLSIIISSINKRLRSNQSLSPIDRMNLSMKAQTAICDAILPVVRESFDSNNNYSYMPQLIAFAMRAQHSLLIELLIKQPAAKMKGNLHYAAEILTMGHYQLALAILPSPTEITAFLWEWNSSFNSSNQKIKFSLALEKSLPSLLQSIKDPAQRYRAECLFSCFPDSQDKNATPLEPLADRMKRLIADFSKKAPSQRWIRMELLAILGQDAVAANYEEAQRLIGKITLGDLVNQCPRSSGIPTNDVQLQLSLIKKIVKIKLLKGDVDSVFEQLKSLLYFQDSTNFAYTAQNIYSECLAEISLLLPLAMTSWDEAKNQQVIQMLLKHLALAQKSYANHRDMSQLAVELQFLLLYSHAAAGRGADFEKNYQSLDKNLRKMIAAVTSNKSNRITSGEHSSSGLPSLGLPFRAFSEEEYDLRRIKLITSLLASEELCAVEFSNIKDIQYLVTGNFVTSDELISIIKGLKDDHKYKPLLLCKIAYREANNRKIAESKALNHLAMELAQKHNSPFLHDVYLHYAMSMQYAMNEKILATEIYNKIDFDRISPDFTRMASYLKQSLGKQPQPKPENPIQK